MIALGFILLLPALASAIALPADTTTTALATGSTTSHTVTNTTLALDEEEFDLEDGFLEDDPEFDFDEELNFEDGTMDDDSLEFDNSTSTLESRAGGYKLSENIVGSSFYKAFNWYSGADPTHGRTKCVTSQLEPPITDLLLTRAAMSTWLLPRSTRLSALARARSSCARTIRASSTPVALDE